MVPAYWDDPAGRIELEPLHTDGYQLWVEPLRLNGNYHLHHWPTLKRRVQEFRPDIIHMDEEPYNLATWLALRTAKQAGAKFLFFSWQNILRHYPIPFAWMEKQVLAKSDFGLMGNRDAAEVFKQKGFSGRHAVIPQFGTDTDTFKKGKGQGEREKDGRLRIGFAGRLIRGKGIDLLLEALSQIRSDQHWELLIAGEGPEKEGLEKQVGALGLKNLVKFVGRKGSAEMPAFLQHLDLLVLPSRTLPNWKEQFGRILVEAMACEIPVIGSSSGEIPNVIGDAGLIFNEGDTNSLAQQLQLLIDDQAEREKLAALGRERVLANFTQAQIAQATVKVYQSLVK